MADAQQAQDDSNGRVTIAVVATELRAFRDESHRRWETEDKANDEQRHTVMQLNGRIQAVEKEQEVQKVRVGVFAGLNAAFSTAIGIGLSFFRK